MGSEIMVALIVAAFGCIGTIVGSYFGVRASNKLTNYRIEELTKKVDKHNSVMERTFVIEEQIKVANHRIEDLEEKEK